MLEVRDTGVGMDEETRRRCLEPFFTTKGKRGTGLGLAMVYGMAQRHDATVEVESEHGAGTTVRLKFPSYIPSRPSSVRFAADPRPSRALRILLVDDDPALINSLRSTLESDGHFVTAAEGGQAGIDAFQSAQRDSIPFEIVITDLGMPYVDGRQVIASVRAHVTAHTDHPADRLGPADERGRRAASPGGSAARKASAPARAARRARGIDLTRLALQRASTSAPQHPSTSAPQRPSASAPRPAHHGAAPIIVG